MPDKIPGEIIEGLGIIQTVESDNILRWDGNMVYVEQTVYHNGQVVHERYRKRVTAEVAKALLATIRLNA